MPCSSSCSSATPLAAASMTSGLPNRIPYRPEAGCCRISASWPSPFPRWRSSCRPRNHQLPRAQQRANQALHSRRLRIEHVNSSVKRCRVVNRAIAYEKSGRWFTAEEPFLRAKERTDAGSSAFRHPRSELTAPLPQEVEPAFNNRKLHMRLPCVVKDRIRLWKQGVRDVVMEIC